MTLLARPRRARNLGFDVQRVTAALLLLFGLTFAIGSAVLGRWDSFAWMLAMTVVGGVWLKGRGPPEEAPPLPEPATHPA